MSDAAAANNNRESHASLPQEGTLLSETELVALLLDAGDAPHVRAAALLEAAGGLGGLVTLSRADIRRLGVGRSAAVRLTAAVELSRRLARARLAERRLLDRPDLLADYLSLRYARQGQEVMGAVFLDCRGRLLADVDLFRGTLHRTAVEPRQILKEALVRDASAVVLFHTHPSGDPAPSPEDLVFTSRLAEAGDVVGVHLADHLILGGAGRWVSLRCRGPW